MHRFVLIGVLFEQSGIEGLAAVCSQDRCEGVAQSRTWAVDEAVLKGERYPVPKHKDKILACPSLLRYRASDRQMPRKIK